MTGAWRFDPFTRIQRWVGDFTEPPESELKQFGYTTPPTDTRRQPINHGTEAGYGQHRRRGEQACDDCRVANNIRHAERRARNNSTTQTKDAA
jgi:hypothetical protein